MTTTFAHVPPLLLLLMMIQVTKTSLRSHDVCTPENCAATDKNTCAMLPCAVLFAQHLSETMHMCVFRTIRTRRRIYSILQRSSECSITCADINRITNAHPVPDIFRYRSSSSSSFDRERAASRGAPYSQFHRLAADTRWQTAIPTELLFTSKWKVVARNYTHSLHSVYCWNFCQRRLVRLYTSILHTIYRLPRITATIVFIINILNKGVYKKEKRKTEEEGRNPSKLWTNVSYLLAQRQHPTRTLQRLQT